MFLALSVEFWNVYKVCRLFIGAFLILLFTSVCWAGVASNPFLRPGSNRTPPKVIPASPPPKPIPNPAFAKEVEFRGYFLLKGIPHFCVFNKKANFGEWIKLTEKTYEEFEAQAFDLDSETLTLAFNGHRFDLTLEQSKSLPGISPSSPSLPKVNLPSNTTVSGNSKVMPPRPKAAPKLPDWLVSRMASRSLSSSSNPSNSRSSRFLTPSRNTSTSSSPVASPISFSQPSTSHSPLPSSTASGGLPSRSIPSFTPSPSSGLSSSSSSSFDGSDPGNSSPKDVSQDTSLNEDDQIELDDLPPPPPPPNILPPSPPPDILPSLDE